MLLENSSGLNYPSGESVSHSEFKFMASTLYGEADGVSAEGLNEVAGIYSVLENRASYENTTVKEQMTIAKGVYGVAAKARNRYTNEKGPLADKKRKNVNGGLIKGIQSEEDFSKGAFYWDGKDFDAKANITGGNRERYVPGYDFTDASHDLFGQGDNSVDKKTIYGKYKFKYE